MSINHNTRTNIPWTQGINTEKNIQLIKSRRRSIIKLCNEKYKENNIIRWKTWSKIFNNQINNLIILEKNKDYYEKSRYINLKNVFITNARNVKIIRKEEYGKISKFISRYVLIK